MYIMKKPDISVCTPVYNAARFIRECIDSVLSQTFPNFEMILVDDGSTDESCAIIESYTDPRIRLIRNRHDFIGTKNRLLDEAQGKYIAFIDSDDRMLTDRLMTQYEYMEAHPEIDVLGGGVWTFGNGSRAALPGITGRAITLDEMIDDNQIYNPTVMLRRDGIVQNGIRYPKEYIYANDYALWMLMLRHGMHLENLKKILTEYRYSPGQISSEHQKEQAYYADLIKKEAIRIKTNGFKEEATDLAALNVPVTGNKLTLIIPFLNEKEEVKNTVASAREFVGDAVDIITINDHSTDGYNYPEDLKPYCVTYVYNKERLGVAASRDLGVRLCTTPYFLLLDSHMRFYEGEWASYITRLLEQNDRRILCCQTRSLHKKDGQVFVETNADICFGAYLPFTKGNYLPDIKWNPFEQNPDAETEPIGAVLGAGYATSKRYWNHIRGLEGLLYYGNDEAYLSIKTWMEGGRCLLLKNVVIGHIYRMQSPFRHYNDAEVFNYLWIATLLFPTTWKCLAMATALYRDKASYESALRMLTERKGLWTDLKRYYEQHLPIPFKIILDINKRINKGHISQMNDKKALFEQVAVFLSSHMPLSDGLVDGKAGLAIWFCHYARYCRNGKWDEKATRLLEEVLNSVDNQESPDFRSGLAGIGWAIVYLFEHRFINEYPAGALEKIDRKICESDLDLLVGDAFETSVNGIMAYAVERMACSRRHNKENPLETALKDKLSNYAQRTVDAPDRELTSLWYAMRLLAFIEKGFDSSDFLPAIHDWTSFRNQIPANSEYWKTGLTECAASATLHALLTIEQTAKTPLS